MKIKINHNNDALYCIYDKEPIEIGEKYIEIVEDYLGEEIVKTYRYCYLDMLVEEQMEYHYLEDIDIDEEYE